MFATDEERRMAALKDKYAKANEKKKVWDEVDQRWKNVEDDEKVYPDLDQYQQRRQARREARRRTRRRARRRRTRRDLAVLRLRRIARERTRFTPVVSWHAVVCVTAIKTPFRLRTRGDSVLSRLRAPSARRGTRRPRAPRSGTLSLSLNPETIGVVV